MGFYLIEDAGSLEECRIVAYNGNLTKIFEIRDIMKKQNKLSNYKIVEEIYERL